MVAYWQFFVDYDGFESKREISMGYGLFESINGLGKEGIKAVLRPIFEPGQERTINSIAGQFLRFSEMEVNDIVVVRRGKSTRNILIGRVTGPYQFDEGAAGEGHAHSYPVQLLTRHIPRDKLPHQLKARLNSRMQTIGRLGDDFANDIQALIRKFPPASDPAATAQPSAESEGSAPKTSSGGSQGRSTAPRKVTSSTIARRRTSDDHDEGPVTGRMTDLEEALQKREERSSAHACLVQVFASELLPDRPPDRPLYEDPFDLAATLPPCVVLAEMKTLDGTRDDEVRQVRHAVGQLLYYEKLSLPDDLAGGPVAKVAVFDKRPCSEHVGWMEGLEIAVAWRERGKFVATSESRGLLRDLPLSAPTPRP